MKRNLRNQALPSFKSLRSLLMGGVLIATSALVQPSNAANKLPDYTNVSPKNIPVCYDYGCKKLDRITLTDLEWSEVAGWFDPPARNGAEERDRIKNAIGWMEVVVGNHAPTFRDKGRNRATKADFPGQLDCIDESINTTTYLVILANEGLIRHHNVVTRAHRKALIDQHFSGQIVDKESGKGYVIDTWFYDNGKLPVVQTTEDWLSIPLFTSYSDNSAQAE